MQLASKMRYISAQLDALLSRRPVAALRRARERDGAAAGRRRARRWPGVRITQPVEANGVFAILPPAVTARLQQDWPFYVWDDEHRRGALDGRVGHDARGRSTRSRPTCGPSSADRHGRARHVDLRPVGVDVDEQPAGPPEVLALQDRDRRRRRRPAPARAGSRRARRPPRRSPDPRRRRRAGTGRARGSASRPRARRAGPWSSRARPSARRAGRSRSRASARRSRVAAASTGCHAPA